MTKKTYNDDNQISNWVKDDVYLLQLLNLMVGDDEGNFNPQAHLTREETASVVAKLYRWITFKVPNMIKRVKKSIVVVTNTHNGETTLGSGTIIDESGLILTNYHCVSTMDKGVMTRQGDIQIKVLTSPSSTSTEGTTEYTGQFVAGSQFDDLAVVKINEDSLPFVEITEENPFEGEPIQVFGHPLALEYTTTAGQISQDLRSVSLRAMAQTDAAINPGNSGGAAISEISEKLIGIPTLKRMDGEGVAYLILPSTINHFLRSKNIKLIN